MYPIQRSHWEMSTFLADDFAERSESVSTSALTTENEYTFSGQHWQADRKCTQISVHAEKQVHFWRMTLLSDRRVCPFRR